MNYIRFILILCANGVALYEAILGLLQVFGLEVSRHTRFVITGSFYNPGIYGGCIAMLLAVLASYVVQNRTVVLWQEKALWWLSCASCALCFIVLPASLSRAAWLGYGVAVLIFGFLECGLRQRIRTHRTISTILSTIAVLLLIGMFFLKKDSAIGRLHIWHMEIISIAAKPWKGYGKGRVLGVYGDTQAAYFAAEERSENIVRVAGSPEFAFNEYLKVGVEYGVPAMVAMMVLVICLIALLLRQRSPFGYGAVVLAVFAFFSYPFSSIKFSSEADRVWEAANVYDSMDMHEEAIESYVLVYEELKGNYRFLYDYGYALHKIGRHEASNAILAEGSRISSDPMFYNIMGKNFEAMGLPCKAEECYRHAHFMVPGRIYPLVLLEEMYIGLGMLDKAEETMTEINKIHINERNRNMQDLKRRAERNLEKVIIQ
ncbi:MAG: O-antigen ligase family protein [Bacteroidales bacterium]|nr:O-antigen ligase family protein [Bacteroidales bacterium]